MEGDGIKAPRKAKLAHQHRVGEHDYGIPEQDHEGMGGEMSVG